MRKATFHGRVVAKKSDASGKQKFKPAVDYRKLNEKKV